MWWRFSHDAKPKAKLEKETEAARNRNDVLKRLRLTRRHRSLPPRLEGLEADFDDEDKEEELALIRPCSPASRMVPAHPWAWAGAGPHSLTSPSLADRPSPSSGTSSPCRLMRRFSPIILLTLARLKQCATASA